MANPRKVQQEIDKLLKKVQEGIDVYDGVFDKVQSAIDRVQKEKYEAELKKEIKKLQRLREQIKGLHASPEVKDKRPLEVTRRAIEVKMEGFKVCERETKTKAFSKEGLATNKTDPAARAKAKTTGWIKNSIQELQDQVEQLEFDIENEANGGGAGVASKRGKKGRGEGGEREERMRRNQYHILKLESLLRVLEMGELEPEDVDEIEPEVQAFVEGFQDPNYEEDDSMDLYGMFDIPEGMVTAIGANAADDDDAEDEEETPSSPAPAAAVPAKAKAKDTPPQKVAPKPAAKKAPVEPAPKKQPSPATPAKAPAPIPIPVGPKTPITPLSKGAASPGKSMADMLAGNRKREEPPKPAAKEPAAAPLSSASAPVPPPAPPAADPGPSDGLLSEDDDVDNDDTFGDDAMDGVMPGAGNLADLASMTSAKLGAPPAAASSGPASTGTAGGDWAKPLPATVAGTAAQAAVGALSNAPALPPASPGSKQAPAASAFKQQQAPPQQQPPQQPQQLQGAPLGLSQAQTHPAAAPHTSSPLPGQPQQVPQAQAFAQQQHAVQQQQQQQQQAQQQQQQAQPQQQQQQLQRPPQQQQPQAQAQQQRPAAASASGAARAPFPASDVIQRMLNVSLRNLPHTSDCERPKPYAPPNPFNTPEYYPQNVHPAFTSPDTFSRFEPDTLFFIFYYQQSSYQQYLAAKELKNKSWRFHKKYQTWFQRHDRPKVTTDEHEQGTYIYFDYEGGWCQRIKADFVFKYAQLEDSLA
jgi:CCR4-NOT transcription complex subunit 3